MGPQGLCGPQQGNMFTKNKSSDIQRELGRAGWPWKCTSDFPLGLVKPGSVSALGKKKMTPWGSPVHGHHREEPQVPQPCVHSGRFPSPRAWNGMEVLFYPVTESMAYITKATRLSDLPALPALCSPFPWQVCWNSGKWLSHHSGYEQRWS